MASSSIHIGRGSTRLGAFSEEEVREGLRTGRFTLTDLGWQEGMENWKPLAEFSELTATPPPPLPGDTPVLTSVEQSETLQAHAGTSGLPWDQRHTLGLFQAFWQTAKLVLFDPGAAFDMMRREGGIAEPFLYFLAGSWGGGVFAALYTMLGHLNGSPAKSPLGGPGFEIFLIFLLPLVFIFVSALINHLCLILVGAPTHSFEATFRVLCFAGGSLSLLQVIPLISWLAIGLILVMGIWHLYIVTTGFAVVHEISTGRALTAVLLPMIVCCGGAMIFGILAGLFGFHLAMPS
jgi:hypothetical protein